MCAAVPVARPVWKEGPVVVHKMEEMSSSLSLRQQTLLGQPYMILSHLTDLINEVKEETYSIMVRTEMCPLLGRAVLYLKGCWTAISVPRALLSYWLMQMGCVFFN